MKDEPTKSTFVATNAFPPRQYGHLGAHIPRRSAGQEAPPLLHWHLSNAFQVEFDTGSQRLLRIVEGCAVGCDIEVGTDRMPLPTTLSSVTSQREVHDSSLGSTCEDIVRRDQRTIGSLRLPEPFRIGGWSDVVRRKAARLGRIRLLHAPRGSPPTRGRGLKLVGGVASVAPDGPHSSSRR